MLEPTTASILIKEVISAAAEPLVRKTLDSLSGKLIGLFEHEGQAAADRLIVALRIGFKDYLLSSYSRCEYFKSLLDTRVRIELNTHYVFVTLTCGLETIRDVDLIADIHKRNSVVIIGLAGSGKSMFMKYLTLQNFSNSGGRLPIIFDLRQLNAMSNVNLLTLIRVECTSSTKPLSEEQFARALSAGMITLILDGFDEVNYERRDEVEKQILDARRNFPKVTMVISSRPDRRFGSWERFDVFEVNKLSKKQCIQLINTFEYDPELKKRFAKHVTDKLYDSHTSFLSSPLLTTIMLLTYEEFANIPQQMHAFYSQAFDTLFQRHDAQKQQFSRKLLTALTKEEFKSCFACFSAMTYLDERFSFNDEYLIKISEKALTYIGPKRSSRELLKKINPKNFIEDLMSSVCMLQQDGLEIAFVHRSFQEYFAALFVVSSYGDKSEKILETYAKRFSDSVISMALEMDRESVQQQWVVPAIVRIQAILFSSEVNQNCALQYKILFPALHLHSAIDGGLFFGFNDINMDLIGPIEILRKLYPSQLQLLDFPGLHLNKTALRKIFGRVRKENNHGNTAVIKEMLSEKSSTVKKPHLIYLNGADAWWLEKAGVRDMLAAMQSGFEQIVADVRLEEQNKKAMLSEYFAHDKHRLRHQNIDDV